MLYHREVFWKPEFDQLAMQIVKSVKQLTRHLNDHIDNPSQRRYNINRPFLFIAIRRIITDNLAPFEVEVESGVVTKAVYRTHYEDGLDISIVVRKGVIITAWLNKSSDEHKTLDKSKYVKG